MRHFFGSVFFGYPLQYPPTTVVVEVHIDIGQGNTVGIKEAFE